MSKSRNFWFFMSLFPEWPVGMICRTFAGSCLDSFNPLTDAVLAGSFGVFVDSEKVEVN